MKSMQRIQYQNSRNSGGSATVKGERLGDGFNPSPGGSNAVGVAGLVALVATGWNGFLTHGPGVLFVELRDGTNPVELSAYLPREQLTGKDCHPGWRVMLDQVDPAREVLLYMYSSQKSRLHRISIAGAGGGMALLN